MPQLVPISAIPSQSFTITLDSNIFDISIKSCAGIMACSFTINNVDTLDGIRAVAGSLLIPYKYLEAGNFLFLTANNELPNYAEFNITQNLIYFTASELASYRVPPALPVTAAWFNPNGKLPLRFAPQNYE